MSTVTPEGWLDVRATLEHHATLRYTKRMVALDTVVIHNSGNSADVGVEAIARWHVENNGWPGIGYHFCIAVDGTTYWTNDLDTMSYHVASHNNHTIGVCLIGNFVGTVQPPDVQLTAARKLIGQLRERFPDLAVKGHKDLDSTRCPGDTWNVWRTNLDESTELALLRAQVVAWKEENARLAAENTRLTSLLAQIETLAKGR